MTAAKKIIAALLLVLASLFVDPSLAAAARPPVFILMLDEFPGAALEDNDGKIDRSRFPSLARISRQATYYPYATTTADLTIRALPSLYSGKLLESGAISPRQTLYHLLRKTHKVSQQETFSDLRDLCSFCRQQPILSSRIFGVPLRSEDFQTSSIRSAYTSIKQLSQLSSRGRPPFWTSHLILPHAPYRFVADGRGYPLTVASYLPSVDTENNGLLFNNRNLVLFDQQRFLRQARLADRFIGYMRRQLTRARMWNKSLVIIAADHGASFAPGTDRRAIAENNYQHIANVPLLVKYPDQQLAKVDRNSAQLIDIAPTVAEVSKRKINWPLSGQSLLHPRPSREVKIFAMGGAGWQKKSFTDFVGLRDQLVSEWQHYFPHGNSDIWLGQGPSLLGRSLKEFEIKEIRAKGYLDFKESFNRVSPHSSSLPLLVSGVLDGVPAQQPLALSLNGDIIAGGYSYFAKQESRFVFFLPEDKLVKGQNRLRLFLTNQQSLSEIKLN